MEFFNIVYEQIKGFFGMGGLIKLINEGNYNSLLTYDGITSVIQPILPIVLILELVRGLLYRKFNVVNYKIPFFTYILHSWQIYFNRNVNYMYRFI